MRITMPRPFSECREFISEELPKLVFRINMDSKAGGKLVRNALKMDQRQNWKILEDSPVGFEASVSLGKSSNRITTGFRRINIKATANENQTVVELRSVNKSLLVVLVGLLFCVLPGLLLLIVKVMHDGFERRVIAKVGAEVKGRFPDSTLQE